MFFKNRDKNIYFFAIPKVLIIFFTILGIIQFRSGSDIYFGDKLTDLEYSSTYLGYNSTDLEYDSTYIGYSSTDLGYKSTDLEYDSTYLGYSATYLE
ncbi:hypothetical protein SAMN05421846_103150 [Chryseobacterium taeanense]|uniref:Uncharacterized protein n=1 Tax=Chryseobacterium taeanense TaxID=311334 RepID=A0A1G8GXA8_9FLAO|nr:hypothetical protein [Chryseobacterium taeanense]SDH99046.1 hypothetical protein SAMN05421846_103150 [Chryseobacterium taeanense]